MGEYPLTQSYFGRAKQETLSECHKVRFWVVEMISAPIVATGMFFAIPDSASPFIKTIVPLAVFSIWMLAVLGGVFLFSLLIAPHRQRNQARQRIKELEAEFEKPKPFDVECRTTTMSLPINLQKDGTWKASAVGISPSQIFIIHRGDLINVTSVTVAPVVLFNYMDGTGWEKTDAITVTPQRPLPAILSPHGAGDFKWDVTNPLQWKLMGLPLTMGKDQPLPLPAMKITVQDANLVGTHFAKFDWCRVVIPLTIRTDKGSPYIPDLFIELTSSDIPNPNPRYYWKDVTNEPKD